MEWGRSILDVYFQISQRIQTRAPPTLMMWLCGGSPSPSGKKWGLPNSNSSLVWFYVVVVRWIPKWRGLPNSNQWVCHSSAIEESLASGFGVLVTNQCGGSTIPSLLPASNFFASHPRGLSPCVHTLVFYTCGHVQGDQFSVGTAERWRAFQGWSNHPSSQLQGQLQGAPRWYSTELQGAP